MENAGKLIGALVLGAVIGAACGILLAPDKGTETRKKLFNGAKDLADDLKEKAQDSINRFKDMAEDRAEEFTKSAKNKMDHQFKSATDKVKTDLA